MKNNILLVLGRQSSGKEHAVNLKELPNLFISYSHDDQLPGIFISFIKTVLQLEQPLQFALSLNSRLAKQVKPMVSNESVFMEFLHQDYEEGKINSIDEFIAALKLGMKTRKAQLKKTASAPVMLPDILVFIDDIFEVLKSKHKKTPLSFIELLLNGADVHMYFFLGSSGIYRSLLEQIIHFNPALKRKIGNSSQPAQISQPLGAELVINPDGLLFFRMRDEKIHLRLYPEINNY